MLLGIDVGGTFTDAVVVQGGRVLNQAKTPTTHGRLLDGIIQVLDNLLAGNDGAGIERVALSTTIVTNAIVENKIDRVGLLMLPGPGANLTDLIPVKPYLLSGYIDHRGREVAAPARTEVQALVQQLADCKVFAISGKFAVRNPEHERTVAQWLTRAVSPQHITLGSAVSGTLNFWRRTNSAYFNAAVWRRFSEFAQAVEQALSDRRIHAPVYVLKADGGTMPLAAAKEQPVEAIFTGPAASVLGIMAMNDIRVPAVSLDIGGTTTDIALWDNGAALFAQRGANIGKFPTAVRAFRLSSVGIGGDSCVRREAGMIQVGPNRLGPAMAQGGPAPTVSDAMIVAGLAEFGNVELARQAMEQIAESGQTPRQAADAALGVAASAICQAVAGMIEEQAAEPVYRVEDIVTSVRLDPELLIGVGGAAAGLVPLVAEMMGVPYNIPDGAMVANAVGAAVARPTMDITLRADTAQDYYTVAELGVKDKLPGRRFSLADARSLSARYLAERAGRAGIGVQDTEVIEEEEFNLVRGFNTVGKIVTCRLQIKPGLLSKVSGFAKGESL